MQITDRILLVVAKDEGGEEESPNSLTMAAPPISQLIGVSLRAHRAMRE